MTRDETKEEEDTLVVSVVGKTDAAEVVVVASVADVSDVVVCTAVVLTAVVVLAVDDNDNDAVDFAVVDDSDPEVGATLDALEAVTLTGHESSADAEASRLCCCCCGAFPP